VAMVVIQMPTFKKVYKKLYPTERLIVNNAVRDIVNNPLLGQGKKGDLAGFFVHKFKINYQQMLLAYEYNDVELLLIALGSHENFYRDLKGR